MAIDKKRGERLEIFINSLNIKHKLFAERVGTSNKFVSQMIHGYSNLTADMAYRIGKAYPKLNKDWLLEGAGEMLIDPAEEQTEGREAPAENREGPFSAVHELLDEYGRRIKQLEEQVAVLLRDRDEVRK